eukprot:bmy_22137T0
MVLPMGLQDLTAQWGHDRGPGALCSAGGQCEQPLPGRSLSPRPLQRTEDPGKLKASENHREGGTALSLSPTRENIYPAKVPGQELQGLVKTAHTHKSPTLPEAAEAGLGNKTKHFTHWINPKVKGQGHKESILLSKDKVAKTKTKNVEKSPPPTKCPVKGAQSEKEEEGVAFFDALQCLDNEFQRYSLQSSQSWFLRLSCNSSKHCPQLTCATQPENPSHVSNLTSAEGTCLYKENTQSRKKEFIGSQTSASS